MYDNADNNRPDDKIDILNSNFGIYRLYDIEEMTILVKMTSYRLMEDEGLKSGAALFIAKVRHSI